MKKYFLPRPNNKKLNTLVLNTNMELEITSHIKRIVIEDKINLLAYNICHDHIHIILVCEEENREKIIRKLKGKSAQYFKKNHNIKKTFNLWAQKYNSRCIETEEQLASAYDYVINNRMKHGLPENPDLERTIEEMLTPYDEIDM